MQCYRFRRVAIACPFLVAFLPLAVAAQTAGDEANSADETGAAIELAPVEVTDNAATKTDTPFMETPQSISRVDREDMEEKGAQTVQRAANYTPGVFTNQIGASNRYDYLLLRGFSSGSVNNTYLNGLKVMSDDGSYSSMVVDPYFLDSMDVVRGPASVLYGRASPGGLVEMNSKLPQFENAREIELGIGNNNQRRAAFDVTGPVGEQGRVAYRLTGLAKKADTQFGPVEEERYALAPSVTWDINADTSLTVLAYLQQDPEGGYHSGLPYEGTVEPRNGIKVDNDFYEGEPGYEKFERTQRQVGYQLDHYFNDTWSFRQNARFLSSDVELKQVYASDTDRDGDIWASATELQRGSSRGDEDLHAGTIDNQLQAQFDSGPVEHTLLVGLDYQERENSVVYDYGTVAPLDIANPQYGSSPSIYYTERIQRELQQTGLYFQDQMQIDNWHLMAGVRQDWVEIDNTNETTGTESDLDETEVSGRAGLLYRFDTGVSPYVSYSTSFSPNSTTDQNGDLLEPTEGEQLEAGVKFQPVGTQDRYSLAVFDITQENVSTKKPSETFYRAVGEIESQGVELSAETRLTDQLRVEADYTYTDVTFARTADSTQGNSANEVPEDQINAWASYAFGDGALRGTDAGLGVRYYADIQADAQNTRKVPDYTLLDATIGYDLAQIGYPGFRVRLNVNNLTDEDYVASCNSLNYCYFGAERNVRATLNYRF